VILENEGWTCIEAASGAEAIQAFLSHRPDVCFLDVTMPDLDGIRVLQTLADQGIIRNAKIYMVSGSDDYETRRIAEAAGARGYLVKPVTPERVLAVIREP